MAAHDMRAGGEEKRSLLFSLDGVSRGHIIAGNVTLLACVDGTGFPPVSLSVEVSQHKNSINIHPQKPFNASKVEKKAKAMTSGYSKHLNKTS